MARRLRFTSIPQAPGYYERERIRKRAARAKLKAEREAIAATILEREPIPIYCHGRESAAVRSVTRPDGWVCASCGRPLKVIR